MPLCESRHPPIDRLRSARSSLNTLLDLAGERPAKRREQTWWKASRVEVELHRDLGPAVSRLEPKRRVDSHACFVVRDGVHVIPFERRDLPMAASRRPMTSRVSSHRVPMWTGPGVIISSS